MSFGSIILGALIGGAISSGAIIGITFLFTLLPWWAVLLIGVGGSLIGGVIAGVLAKGVGAGALAGLLSGLIVLIASFLFLWLYYKYQVMAMIGSVSSVSEFANEVVNLFGLGGTGVGDIVEQWVTANVPTIGDIQAFANANFHWFALILGAIFGGIAAVTNFFAGMIGGLFTRGKKESYDSYY